MTLWFQSILVIMLALLCVFLILLLRQLQDTAAAVQRLAESAKDNLQQVANDIHDLGNRADRLLGLAADNLALPLNAKNRISRAIQTVDAFLTNKHLTWLGIIFTNIKFASRLIRKSSKED